MDLKNLLLVDEDRQLFTKLKSYLENEGYSLSNAPNGEEALSKLTRNKYNLILLDLKLPGIDGFEFTRRLKYQHNILDLPIIVVSSKNDEIDIVSAFELGIDDYLIKPVRLKELNARIRAVLRRTYKSKPLDGHAIRLDGFEMIPAKRSLNINGKSIQLSNMEYQIFHTLVKRPGWTFSRNQIIDLIRGGKQQISERSVDVQIAGIRKKLGKYGKYVETVRMIGYRYRSINNPNTTMGNKTLATKTI